MTNIRYRETDEHISLVIDGHSGYAESGADIVCSAISLLAESFVFFLDELQEEDKIQIHAETIQDGLISINYDDVYGFTLSNLKQLQIGFLALQEEYPNNVFVEWGENDF